MVLFAHIADSHLGAFRDPALRELNLRAFEKALDECKKRDVDFLIIAGDLFDISIPDLSVVERAVRKLRELEKPVYAVYGSHDYSPTQTSVIDVLNEARVLTKVSCGEYGKALAPDSDEENRNTGKAGPDTKNADAIAGGRETKPQNAHLPDEIIRKNDTDAPSAIFGKKQKLRLDVLTDPKTGVKITGISARKLGLEKTYFQDLDAEALEKMAGPKIFVFHCAIQEHKPSTLQRVDAVPLSLFPKGFDYYAGGHVHARLLTDFGNGKIVYPGPLSFADFRDLEEVTHQEHGFYAVDLDARKAEFVPVHVAAVRLVRVDAEGLDAKSADAKIQSACNDAQTGDVLLLHVKGTLSQGKPSEIDWQKARKTLVQRGPVVYLNNALETRERNQVRVDAKGPEAISEKVFRESLADSSWSQTLKGESGVKTSLALLEALREENPGDTKKRWDDVVAAKGEKVLSGP